MNNSSHSNELISTDQGEEKGTKFTDVKKTILIVAYVIILLISFVGNSLVIHIVRTRTMIRKNPFNWLLVNTAVADLVDVTTASSFLLPYFLCGECWLSGVVGTVACKVIPFFLVVSICVSIWTLTVIAADRYLAIVCVRKKALSSSSVIRSIAAVWLCAGIIFCGQLYKFKTDETEDGTQVCYHEWHEDWETSTLFYKVEMIVRVVITYAVPLVIMTVLYSLIARFLWTRKPPGNVNQKAVIKQTRKRRAVIKMMITVVTVFALCWLPVQISHIMSLFYSDAYDAIPTILKWLLYWLAHANAAIHPWLFIVCSENLRLETIGVLRNIWNANSQKGTAGVSLPTLLTNLDVSAPRAKSNSDVAVNTI